ncbi:class II fructose-1,6-bisphosphate aldolase [Spiroplasma attinicola]|uniref:class II fructose-1,6-bisphosphate aldolase n=1 Tax=Spiroplasma attinicola TaxID=2904537 RepID=UPI0020229D96|nr:MULTISPECIES: class II fructose-1,6-bisphosphate aldolase [unclassified Spiroplasma]MCL8210256.1 putative fructose-bisphosphate aldolase [Spiroplasma sp. JKS002670]MCL8210618.1 putative fructose-bisphosphate aldolase [Spiroplasma sp. JKS002671]
MKNFVNAKALVDDAKAGKYAVAHFNINNLEWTKSLLEVAQETKSGIILGASEGAIKYMGGYNVVANMVKSLMADLKITVPIVLHLDHGQSYQACQSALEAGFTSVMFDGSHLSFPENLETTKKVIALAKKYHASVEAEAGSVGGEEDGVVGLGEVADPQECQSLAKLGIDILAAGINNVHGRYPDGWKGLNFDVLKQIAEASNKPLVLHGGSGIPKEQVAKAISLGIAKVNVNTELQEAFAGAIRNYIINNKDQENKGYDPRKLMKDATLAIKTKAIELLKEFGSYGKS